MKGALIMWEVYLNKRVICGEEKLDELGAIVQTYGKKAFVVTYKSGMRNTGIPDRLENTLKKHNMPFVMYEAIDPDPDIESIDNGASLCREQNCDVVIGIGGGSALDASKAIAMLMTNPGSVREYQMGHKTIINRPIPVIAIPTTSGTGSEATKVSVVTNVQEGIKKSLSHPYLIPDVAIIDPLLTVSLPAGLTASTGMDALGHAIESYVSLDANPITEAYGIKAVELIAKYLPEAVHNGKNVKAREKVAIASYMAGVALNAGVGVAHMIGQPMGAVYHAAHGDAISILLPAVMEVNLEFSVKKYSEIARALGIDCHGRSELEAGIEAISAVKKLRDIIGAPKTLKDVGITGPEKFNDVLDSIRRSTSHIKCNPRPVDESLMLEVLNMVL